GVTPFTGFVEITSTQNANLDRVADADVLSFADFATPSALPGFEGTSVTAIVSGRIADDGRLEVTGIALAPGEAAYGGVDELSDVATSGPCSSGCGEACAAIGSPFTQPLCGAEKLPSVLNERIRSATASLAEGATASTKREAKRAVRLAMRQLRR